MTFRIPTPLRTLAGGHDTVEVEGDTVREALGTLTSQYSGLKSRLCDEHGHLRRFVNLFLGEEDIRHLDGLDTNVHEGAVLSIIPAVAGGD